MSRRIGAYAVVAIISIGCAADEDALGAPQASATADTGSIEATADGPGATVTSGGAPDGSTTSDGGAYEEDEGGSGCAYVCPGPTPEGMCDVFEQNCPPDQKCMPWANDGGGQWNATRCAPLMPGAGLPGDPCTAEGSGVSGIDDCSIGSMCWNVDPDTNEGECIAFCTGSVESPECSEPSTICALFNNVLALCLPTCDPLAQDCGGGQACVPWLDKFFCVADYTDDAGAYGDPCEYINACDPGLFCANADVVPGCAGSLGCCSEFCDVTAADPDAACSGQDDGQVCFPYFPQGEAPLGHEDVGVCIIP